MMPLKKPIFILPLHYKCVSLYCHLMDFVITALSLLGLTVTSVMPIAGMTMND
jgi:4-hydroxybenzoate polyprenyltransferase